jgi:hypothetical protein
VSSLFSRYELVVPLVTGATAFIAINLFADCKVVALYESMRSSLFTGFFTLSGFLLTAKTFVILNMKKEVYGTDMFLKAMKQKYLDLQEWPLPKPEEKLTVYKPLRDIGDQLAANVALTLLTAVCQFTIGLWPTVPVIATCLGLAACSVALLGFSLFYITRNLRFMYSNFEREAHDKMKGFKEPDDAPTSS